tara:strand:+ start:32 stop:196 length:165 start_codon:yes stop_codon:yes gene_type:complete
MISGMNACAEKANERQTQAVLPDGSAHYPEFNAQTEAMIDTKSVKLFHRLESAE